MKIGTLDITNCKIGSTQVNEVRIGSTLVWQFSSLDPDAQAFITAAAITNPTQQTAINTLVVSLKGYGLWTKMKAIYPFVGGTATTHKFNLKNPLDTDAAFRLVFNGGWTHSSNGAQPNGTNAWANTHLNPNSILSLTSAHMAFYSRSNVAASTAIEMGVYSLAPNYFFHLHSRYTGDINFSLINVNVATSYPNNSSLGLFVATRTGATSNQAFRNNSSLGTNTNAVSGVANTFFIVLGAGNINGVITNYSNKQCAFSSIGDGLSPTDTANFYTAVQTFNTTLGRQVGVPIVSDSDAQAFLNAAVIEDVTQANAVNQLVIDMKAANIWSKMKALYPFVGGTAASHKFNLKNPLDTDAAFRLVFNGGWVHSANGAQPNGTNAWANTFLVPRTTLTLNNSHLSHYSRTQETALNGYDMNAFDSATADSNEFGLTNFYNVISRKTFTCHKYPSESATFINSSTQNFLIGSRTAPNLSKIFVNGIVRGTQSTTVTTLLPNVSLAIGGTSRGIIPAYQFSSRQCALASIGDGLTDTEAANFYTAVQTFQTTLNRQI
jgi:hypothetical protein